MSVQSDYFSRLLDEFLAKSKDAHDSCYVCGRSSDEVRRDLIRRVSEVYSDHESDRAAFLRDVDESRPFSYLTYRAQFPVCMSCYGSLINQSDLKPGIDELISELREKADELWPDPHRDLA